MCDGLRIPQLLQHFQECVSDTSRLLLEPSFRKRDGDKLKERVTCGMHRYDRCGGIPGDVGVMSDGKDERIRKERQSDAVVKGHGPVEAADANSNKKSYCTPTRLLIYIVLSKTRGHLFLLPPAKK